MSEISIERSADLPVDQAEMGYDGDTFYFSFGGVVVARRGNPWAEASERVVLHRARLECGRNNRPTSGMGSLHFRYEPPGSEAVQ